MPHCSVCSARVWDGAKRCPACGADLVLSGPTATPRDAAAELVGRRMGDKFVLRELIGTGATGHVFRADQTTLGRTVAVKVLREHLASDPEVVKRFHDEALAASRLNHPNTVAVIDYGQEHNLIWVTALDENGEIWCAPNPKVRVQANWTLGRTLAVENPAPPMAPVS